MPAEEVVWHRASLYDRPGISCAVPDGIDDRLVQGTTGQLYCKAAKSAGDRLRPYADWIDEGALPRQLTAKAVKQTAQYEV